MHTFNSSNFQTKQALRKFSEAAQVQELKHLLLLKQLVSTNHFKLYLRYKNNGNI